MSTRVETLSWTTNTAGGATVTGSSMVGECIAVKYIPGTTDTGATVTVTVEGNMTTTLLVKASAGTANVIYYPRVVVHGNTDGAALTGTSGGDRALLLVHGQLKVVIASGGAVKVGSVQVFIRT